MLNNIVGILNPRSVPKIDYLLIAGGGGGGCSFGGGAQNGGAATGFGGSGGSGVTIFRYPDTIAITIGAGLTGSTATDGSFKVTTITAGTGNVSWA